MLSGGLGAAYNVGRKIRSGILPPTPQSTCSQHFLWGFYKSGLMCWRGDQPYIKKTESDFLRARMPQQLDLSSESIPLPHYSSLFFLRCCASSETTAIPTRLTAAVGVMASQMGTFFLSLSAFTEFHWWQQQGQDKVKSSIKYFLLHLSSLHTN